MTESLQARLYVATNGNDAWSGRPVRSRPRTGRTAPSRRYRAGGLDRRREPDHPARPRCLGRAHAADCGANGITLIGTADRHPVDNRVADNDIHHCGVINKFVADVFLGLSDGTPVQHNAIHDVPHHAINLGLAQDERGNLSAGSVTKTRGVYLDDFTSNCFVHGNIVFAKPQRADYSLLPDSPAHALSIVGIDQARIGPRSGRAR